MVYIITSLGFVRQSFDALVDGIENSIIQAHENLRPGSIFLNNGKGLIASSLWQFSCFLKIDYFWNLIQVLMVTRDIDK